VKGPRRWRARLLGSAAVLAALLILARWWVIDLARVSSPSMAPLLMGSAASGDSVLFLKRAFARRPWQRYDLAVFRATGEANGVAHPVPTIKRIVGLPTETIELRQGDLYLQNAEGKMEIVKKEHALFDELLVPVAELDAAAGRNAGFLWNESSGALHAAGLSMDGSGATPARLLYVGASRDDGHANDQRPLVQVTDGFLDDEGRYHEGNPPIPVSDLRFEVDLMVEDDQGEIELTLRDGADVYRLLLAGARSRESSRITKNGADMTVQPTGVVLAKGRRYRLDFYNIDTNVGFYLDDREIAVNDDPAESRVSGDERNAPELAVLGMRVLITRARLSRDLYWLSVGSNATTRPYTLRDRYFMLGDNSAESIDSRVNEPIASDDLIGRPVAIVHPWRRSRRL
jgi:signal peptidase I